jgi:hypothetical protein
LAIANSGIKELRIKPEIIRLRPLRQAQAMAGTRLRSHRLRRGKEDRREIKTVAHLTETRLNLLL